MGERGVEHKKKSQEGGDEEAREGPGSHTLVY